MDTKDYTPVAQCDSDAGSNHNFSQPYDQAPVSIKRKTTSILLATLLGTSLLINALLLYQRCVRPWELYNELPSQHARLRRDVPRDLVPPEEFSSLNRTIQDAAWADPRMITWELFVALDEDYVVSQNVPHSQRWPWDLSKGVYIPVAAHELHCVNVIRIFVNEMEDGVPKDKLTWGYTHTVHCLNILRESVMCNTDDMMMYTGRLHDNLYFEHPEAGRGQMRMCRNWDTLMDWAHERSACYLSVNRGDPGFPEIDRYKYCPDGSRPWDKTER